MSREPAQDKKTLVGQVIDSHYIEENNRHIAVIEFNQYGVSVFRTRHFKIGLSDTLRSNERVILTDELKQAAKNLIGQPVYIIEDQNGNRELKIKRD